MTRPELIQLVGDVITDVDVLRSAFSRGTQQRLQLDDLRDSLDTAQRRLVRNVLQDNTQQFQSLTKSLQEVNATLRDTITDVNKVAETLDTLVQFVRGLQEIVALIG